MLKSIYDFLKVEDKQIVNMAEPSLLWGFQGESPFARSDHRNKNFLNAANMPS